MYSYPELSLGIDMSWSTPGYPGSIMVSKHMAVGDSLSHVALPGLALEILFNFNPFIGAFASWS
jgi:ABC-type Mn2+/Zn2+ transport system permease subunit